MEPKPEPEFVISAPAPAGNLISATAPQNWLERCMMSHDKFYLVIFPRPSTLIRNPDHNQCCPDGLVNVQWGAICPIPDICRRITV